MQLNTRKHLPLFVDDEENGGEACDYESRYNGQDDDQVESRKIISWETK